MRLTRLMQDGTPDIVQALSFPTPGAVAVLYFDGTLDLIPEEIMYTLEPGMSEAQRYEAAYQDARTLFFARPEVKEAIRRSSGIEIAGCEEQFSLAHCSNETSYVGQWAMRHRP